MTNVMFKRFLPLACLLIGAPAQADPAGLIALQTLDTRLATVGHRLAIGAAALCPAARGLPGFAVQALVQYKPEARGDAKAAFGLDDRPAILAVVPGSAADRAGLRAGDVLVAIDGAAVAPLPPGRKADYEGVGAIEQRIEIALARSPVDLSVDRRGRAVALRFTPQIGCPTRFQVLPSDAMNASADGTYVQVSSRIIEFTRNDDELAILVAHELAHNILGHRQTLDSQHVSRGLLRAFGKNRERIRATEEQADRLAIWLAARAGYDIDAAPGYWDRLMRATSFGIFADGTHDGRKVRIANAEAEIAAVKARRAAGQPLDPPRVASAQQSSSQPQ